MEEEAEGDPSPLPPYSEDGSRRSKEAAKWVASLRLRPRQ